MIVRVVLLIVALVAAMKAHAQDTPQPILRATLTPESVLVGRPVMLRIEILGPNFLTGAPTFPDIQLANAITRPLGSGTNLSEEHQGTTYAGVMHEFAIYPQEPGAYAIAGQSVTVTYAIDPPRSSPPVTMALPDLAFTATVPDAARDLDPFLASTRLTLHQSLDPQPGDLKVGDRIARTITVAAEDLPAMLLPPVRFAASDGLSAYPDQPRLDDKTGQRGGPSTGTRIDRATYILGKPGTFALPAIEVRWWNVDEQKVETARAGAVTLMVQPNPAFASAAGQGDAAEGSHADTVRRAWPWLVAVAVLLAASGRFMPRAVRALATWRAKRRSRYIASEAYWFSRFRAATRDEDSRRILSALLAWIDRVPAVHPATLDAFVSAAGDPKLATELSRLKSAVYASSNDIERTAHCSPRRLRRLVRTARRRLCHGARQPAGVRSSRLPPLNPGSSIRYAHQSRPPAR